MPGSAGSALGHPNRLSLAAVGRGVFSFETAFALYANSGLYIDSIRFAWLPVHLGRATTALSLSIAVWLVLTRRVSLSWQTFTLPCLIGALGLWMLVSLIWAPFGAYGPIKTAYTLTYTLWSISGAVLIAQDRARVTRFLAASVAMAAWFAVEQLLFGMSTQRLSASATLGSDYLGYSGAIGFGILVLVGVAALARSSPLGRLASLAAVGPMLIAIVKSGGRGPMLGLLPAVMVFPACGSVAVDWARRTARIRQTPALTAVLLIVGSAVYLAGVSRSAAHEEYRALERLQHLQGDATLGERLPLFRAAVRMWLERPVTGWGAGSYPVVSRTGFQYPHNALLEVLAELGLVGACLYLTLVLVPTRRLLSLGGLPDDPLRVTVLSLLVYVLLQSIKSYDLCGNRIVYITLALATMPPRAVAVLDRGRNTVRRMVGPAANCRPSRPLT